MKLEVIMQLCCVVQHAICVNVSSYVTFSQQNQHTFYDFEAVISELRGASIKGYSFF